MPLYTDRSELPVNLLVQRLGRIPRTKLVKPRIYFNRRRGLWQVSPYVYSAGFSREADTMWQAANDRAFEMNTRLTQSRRSCSAYESI